ncbi:haloacid dehalogenase [Flavobacterium suaedae]|uniref:Haloacid dehalogenase n=1 Tax=Flavobacterium suaedae TaxID=1767027 RepID=A0ABQ1JQ58_9FLAO|nr:HAD family phosphatase [Flavobacterium suaedae]GGB74761.1 haloacid dehalogenase [Flavobacterium suaedae]
MVKTIIFDFGNVFLDKDKESRMAALAQLGLKEWTIEHDKLEEKLELGKLSADEFLEKLQPYTNGATIEEIKEAWNTDILSFPLYRLEFLQKLSQDYKLFLLSNTDPIHVEKFETDCGTSFYSDFYQCFEKVYFSHEIGLRKPEEESFNHILKNHNIQAKYTLVVDDNKINTNTAESLGFQVWNLQKGREDVVELFDKKIISREEA